MIQVKKICENDPITKDAKQSSDLCAQEWSGDFGAPPIGPHSQTPHTPTGVVGMYEYWLISLGVPSQVGSRLQSSTYFSFHCHFRGYPHVVHRWNAHR